MPPKKNMQPMQKPEKVFGTFKRIFSYMYGFKLQLILAHIDQILIDRLDAEIYGLGLVELH